MSEINVRFPDGSEKQFQRGTTPFEIAKSISDGLSRNTVAAEANEKLIDSTRPLTEDTNLTLLTTKDEKGLEVLRHSCAHILAQAVLRLYPDAKPTIGPVIENGFFYDFDNLDINDEDLPKIESEMKKIVKEKLSCERHEYKNPDEAKKDYPDNQYKHELIEEFSDGELSKYSQGEFFDLCRGPHIPNTKFAEAFKITKTAQAYWRGDSDNVQLTRIYGLCFATKKELSDYLEFLEEAKKRDHRKIGKELGLMMFHEVSPGSPFFLPKGAVVYNELLKLMREEYQKRGYDEVVTPLLYDKSLWEKSGHWEHYKENMFMVEVEGRIQSLKPMNCPGHCLMYANDTKSYRDLPIKIADFAPLHRNELSGTLSGLTRVRKFSQDDSHIFCTMDQLTDELKALMEFMNYIYVDVFKMEYTLELSTRPEKFMGEIEQWEQAELALANVLKELELRYRINEGDGAFYGPKIDVHVRDAIGRSHQCATIQLDFQLPERFDLTYEGSDGVKHRPVMIHRAILGSLERFFAVMVEHFAGKFPLWLSPEQVRVLPIADRHTAHSAIVVENLKKAGLRATLDDRALTTNKKIREAELDRVNYIFVVGDREVDALTVNVRTRENKICGEKPVEEMVEKLKQEVSERSSESLL